MGISLQEALRLDEAGDEAHRCEITRVLGRAFSSEPSPGLAARWINHRLATSNLDPMAADALASQCLLYWPMSPQVVKEFVIPVVACLRSRGTPRGALALLESIPCALRARSSVYQQMRRDLARTLALEKSEGEQLVPWERLDTAWWEQPSRLPPVYRQQRLDRWYAMGVLDLDDRHMLYFQAAEIEQGQIKDYPLLGFEGEEWNQLLERSHILGDMVRSNFWEMGVYGSERRIVNLGGEDPYGYVPVLTPQPNLYRYDDDIPF